MRKVSDEGYIKAHTFANSLGIFNIFPHGKLTYLHTLRGNYTSIYPFLNTS